MSLTNGFAYLDTISWDAFSESSAMMDYIEQYKQRFGYYPEKVLADQVYCTRENRRKLKELSIRLIAKPLERPKAVANHVRPGQRNPIEGKFGQAKNAYGMNRIRARLRNTSQSWIASIIMDCLNNHGVEPGQTGRGGTPMPGELFSMEIDNE